MRHGVQHKLVLTHPKVLLSEHYYRRLWLTTRNVDIPRREWLDELADTFRDFNGTIWQENGEEYELPVIDDAFGDDFEMRWMGYFLRPDITGACPHSKSRKVERLQLLDLYFRIKHPHIAKHFNR